VAVDNLPMRLILRLKESLLPENYHAQNAIASYWFAFPSRRYDLLLLVVSGMGIYASAKAPPPWNELAFCKVRRWRASMKAIRKFCVRVMSRARLYA
jgi:hypothetical protein